MASKALLKKKKGSGDPLRQLENGLPASEEARRHSKERCPTFWVQYLGKMPAKGEFGKEFISEPVETLCKMREKQKLPKTALTISPKGFHFMDCHGPFGKEKHVIIPIHHVCYGIADAQYPRVFAIITRSDSDPESSLFECHAFLCEKRKTAQLITYWLLRTFLQVFENLQRKRYHRKRRERRKLESQMHLNSSGSETNSSTSSDQLPPPQPLGNEYVYSVILEGSQEQGASVRISRDKMASDVTGRRKPMPSFTPDRGDSVAISIPPDFHQPVDSASTHVTVDRPPARPRTPGHQRSVHGSVSEIDEINNPRYFKFRKKSQPRTPIYERHFSMDSDTMTTLSSASSLSASGSESYSESSMNGSSASGNSNGSEKDFMYIKMLQDGVSSLDVRDDETNKTSKQIAQDLGLPTRLTDKDIHRRIQEWLRLTLKDDDEDEDHREGYYNPREAEVRGVASRGDYF
ncbi:uncharacterized protein [Ptychodera flava]|uniref:uncharacterized protein n=1 Tax=Ptychodera flava TaxID=63121 RepID=UPI00396A41E1